METDKVTISLEKYNDMFEEIINLKNIVKDLEKQIKIQKIEYANIEENIYKEIYQSCSYHVKNITEREMKDEDGYNFRELRDSFRKRGYRDYKVINEIIRKMVEQYQKEKEETKEDN